MPNLKTYLKTKDFLLTQEEFKLVHDPVLDMLITKPRPENLEKYYNTKAYISHQDKSKSILDRLYHVVKLYALGRKINLINRFSVKEKTLLDIGTGTGDFLISASKANWKTEGVEPSETARTKAKEKGLSVVSSLANVKGKSFQIITLWHVLEHIPNLQDQIVQIKNLLNANGTLVVAVPNFKSHDAAHYGKYWAAFDTPRHLWHFSQNSISSIFSQHGLQVVKTLPMQFDSYYVSLLSEKYKTGKSNFLNAFYRGWLSNAKAKKTNQYSSLIYIIKKS